MDFNYKQAREPIRCRQIPKYFQTLSDETKNRIAKETKQKQSQMRQQREENTLKCIDELKRQVGNCLAYERHSQYETYLLDPENNFPFIKEIQWGDIMSKCNVSDINKALPKNMTLKHGTRIFTTETPKLKTSTGNYRKFNLTKTEERYHLIDSYGHNLTVEYNPSSTKY